jgi:uncharacterized protein YycO
MKRTTLKCRRISLIPVLLAACLGIFSGCSDAGTLRDGDIIFHRSQSRQAKAIAAATKSDFTHMGINFFSGDKPFVYEAIQPVTKTPLDQWIQRGLGGRYVVKRLKSTQGVDFNGVNKVVQKFMGRDYDLVYGWSDKKIYCSELVWKAYDRAAGMRIGPLKKLRDFDLTSPIVRKMMQERYGKKNPLDMDVIAPSDMFESNLLFTVAKN